jgi:soluble lytic murein transglycosylase-like protein
MKWKYLIIGAVIIFLIFAAPTMIEQAKKKTLDRIEKSFGDIIRELCSRYSVPVNRVFSIVAVESGGNAGAVGPTGDFGLMQITAIAVKQVNMSFGTAYTLDDMKFPIPNVTVGIMLLSYLMGKFGGNVDLATRAFNIGETVVRKNPNADTTYLSKVVGWETIFDTIQKEKTA